MADDRPIDDPLGDERFAPLTGRLTSAFDEQAERFEPSDDAYARLAGAVNRPPSRTTGWLRPLAAAAAVAMLAGGAAFLLAQGGNQALNTGPGEEAAPVDTTTFDSPPSDSEAMPTTEPVDEPGADRLVPPDLDGDGSPPTAPTRLEAAEQFLTRLGIVGGDLSVEGDEVVVAPLVATDAQTRLQLVELDDGFAVVEATGENVAIDEVDTTSDPGSITVSGRSSSVDETVIELVSALHPRPLRLAGSLATSLSREPSAFAASLPVVGSEHAWVVARPLDQQSFAARLVTYRSVDDPGAYAVVRVRVDDPDGGLLLRSGPGTANDAVGVIPPGTGGLRRVNDPPVLVGDDIWWRVEPPDGETGWVNSRFVASAEPIGDEELLAVGEFVRSTLLVAATSVDDDELGLVAYGPRTPVAIGTLADPQLGGDIDELSTRAGWTVTRALPMPPEYGEPFDGDLFTFHRVADWADAEIEVDPRPAYEIDRAAADAYFGGLSSVAITAENPTGAWDRTIVYVESAFQGAEIVAVVLEVQRP